MKTESGRERCLVVGCGDIGTRLVRYLPADNYEVCGVRRTACTPSGAIAFKQADAGNEEQMLVLLETGYDVVVITLTPGQYHDEAYRKTYVESMGAMTRALGAQSHLPRLVLFVSSSSVYGQCDGSWVDEASETVPNGHAGIRLREAEQLLLDSSLVKSGRLSGCVVRFSGIYGSGRHRLIQQVRDGKGCDREPELYTNRIHAEDCAGVLAHLIQVHGSGKPLAPVYLASDCEPVSMWDIKHWLAKTMGYSPDHLQPEAISRTSKRCSNRRLLDTGYQFHYPTFRQGYGAVLDAMQEEKQAGKE